jgi:PASTA domain-containing protein
LSLVTNLLSVVRRIAIVIVIAVAFLFGVVSTVYLSLRSPEVKVPDLVGKDRFEAEKILADADLNFRIRATRPSNQVKPDTVLFQLPRGGEVVKAGQTVAMDVSRATKAGEASETVKPVESESPNSNTSTNTNENKPRRPKNTNENANGNANANANRNANVNRPINANINRPINANRPNANSLTPNANLTPRSNSNQPLKPPSANGNDNRRPVTPRPAPTVPNPNRN